MGDFSRDPANLLAESLNKHYVAVRLQQGVPVLDADWNVLDDLRRAELESMSAWSIGDGVPTGSNGFAIAPLPGGGQNTIVLQAASIVAGNSSIEIDVAASTAAAALGFTAANSTAQKSGNAPARLTGLAAQPFGLASGGTLVLSVNNQAPVTITFNSAGFAAIAAATAAEVVAAITAATGAVTASAGQGNDFIIRGGNGTTAGRIVVDGMMVLIESDIKYSEQALFQNSALATGWNVQPLPALTTPAAAIPYIAYLDVWHREVDSTEDEGLLDVRIGIETAIRLRREWVVRVARETDYAGLYAARPAGHSYYPLARINRSAGVSAINPSMLADLRRTDNSLRRSIAYRNEVNTVLVTTEQFEALLVATRDTVREFIQYLTTEFVDPNDSYAAGEVIGIDALSAIAGLIDQGLVLLRADNMGTRDALEFFAQLQALEERFVSIWRDTVLPLNKSGGQIYANAFTAMIDEIDLYLAGPAPGAYITVPEALERGDLYRAGLAQERINNAFGQELSKPTGFLTLKYLGSTTPTILRNQSFDLRYEVSGSVAPDDDIDVDIYIDSDWPATLQNGDGSTPYALRMGPGVDDGEFIVSVQAPDVAADSTTFGLLVYARTNKGGLRHVSTTKTLTINDPPPASEEGFVITILSTNMMQEAGIFQFPTSISGGLASMNFRLANNTMSSIVVDLSYEPQPAPPGWTIIAPPAGSLTGVTIPPQSTANTQGFNFVRPGANGSTLSFTLRATQQGTTNIVGEVLVQMVTVAG
jgi:hypothetical protein